MANISIYLSNKQMLNSLSLALCLNLTFYVPMIHISSYFFLLIFYLFLSSNERDWIVWQGVSGTLNFPSSTIQTEKSRESLNLLVICHCNRFTANNFIFFCLSSLYVDKVSIKNTILLDGFFCWYTKYKRHQIFDRKCYFDCSSVCFSGSLRSLTLIKGNW